MRRRPLVPFLLAVLVVAAGCTPSWTPRAGGGATRAADAKPRLSRAQLTRGANAVCSKRFRAVAALGDPPLTRNRAAPFFARVAAIERAEVVGLLALRPPRALEHRYVKLVGSQLELARAADRFHRALVARDAHERRRAIADVDRLSARYDRAARSLGLRCRQTF